jgi:hypothetical protein
MPVIFLKSGGTVTCTAYTLKEGMIRAVDVKFKDVPGIPEDRSQMSNVDVSPDNILYIIPGKLQ